MSTHKIFDKVCIIVIVIALLVTALFMTGKGLDITADNSVSLGYEDTLFDDSYVHTIDIEIDDWDSFIETATSEEYTSVDVTIDGEKLKNVALRAKGNTSLTTVQQLDSERYSLKLEFDRFQENNTYHGLDKLCLNNLIQDYTMMKDYIAYKLMNEFGVASPLVSYVYVTINGEDWGLFLAVEAVEDSFLERNYGSTYGDLYKPDSMSMGGGRGNGGGFDMREMDFDQMGMKNPFERDSDKDSEETSEGSEEKTSGDSENSGFPDGFSGGDFSGGPLDSGGPGEFGMGSSDAKLQYSDDDVDSYSTIFDSSKTIASYKDKKRLIRSLKNLSEGIESSDAEEIAEAVDVDAVLRYMVVHNFVVNGDSYTGSMIHNYYLYEEDGLMSMIPWDYNLAYGTFQSDDADSAVNDPIDTPLSITEGSTDRPMFAWITSCEEYTELYHEYYENFLSQFYESGYLTNLIDTTYNMIKEYVEKDPTKFCETSEFETAVETIKEFVTLRCQSIEGQLAGTIGSTDSAQEADPDALIDASSITLSDMGSMGGGGGPGGSGGGPGGSGGPFGSGGPGGSGGPDSSSADNSDDSSQKSGHGSKGSHSSKSHGKSSDSDQSSSQDQSSGSSKNSDVTASSDATASSESSNITANSDNSSEQSENMPDFSNFSGPDGDMPDFANFGGPGGDMPDFGGTSSFSTKNLLYLGGYLLLLTGAIIFAKVYKRRK